MWYLIQCKIHIYPLFSTLLQFSEKSNVLSSEKTKNEGRYTGYNTSKIKASEEVDEIMDFCGK